MNTYPTEVAIQRIKEWPSDDPTGWFCYVKEAGNYWPDGEFGWHEEDTIDDLDRAVRRYHISTGGWSGNEDILQAMGENIVLWMLTWQSHRRGGHYVFEVPMT